MRLERIQLDANGLRFDVLVAGPEDGDPVILLHGFPQTSYCWRHQIDHLAATGFRVVAPDQRGYSPGARPADVASYGIHHLVADVVALADAVAPGARFGLVGHDWGAAVAWQVAARRGDRVKSLVALSVPHPLAFTEALQDFAADQAERSSYFDRIRPEGSEAGLLADDAAGLRAIYDGAGLSEEEAAPYLIALGSPEALRAAINWYRAPAVDLVRRLSPVTTPTLYVWSTDDVSVGERAANACTKHVEGRFRFVVLKGVDHWIPEHAPTQLNELLTEHMGITLRS